MKINESRWDSVIRILGGCFLLYLGISGELAGAFAILADISGFIFLLTGVIGFCPLCTLFRWKK